MTISVIIPVWNRRELLLRAIKSVAVQSYPVSECIIVDDGSTDGTLNRAREYVSTLEQYTHMSVQFLRIPHCGMAGKVRNYGIRHAKGHWIALLDSDDEWLPDKLMKQVCRIEETRSLWCHTRERWIRNTTEISQRKQRHVREGDVFKDSLRKCIIGPSTVLLHKQLFEECGFFREDLEIAEDYELWLRISNRYPICYVDEGVVCKYAGHDAQLSTKYPYIEKFRIDALQTCIDNNEFHYDNRMCAMQELKRKQEIWTQGVEKRRCYETHEV